MCETEREAYAGRSWFVGGWRKDGGVNSAHRSSNHVYH